MIVNVLSQLGPSERPHRGNPPRPLAGRSGRTGTNPEQLFAIGGRFGRPLPRALPVLQRHTRKYRRHADRRRDTAGLPAR
jgi:hypothetical protein